MLTAVGAMLAVQFWIRTYHFNRSFRLRTARQPHQLFSPVEGTLVYVRTVQGEDIYADKGDRQVRTPLRFDQPHLQFGVFMGPYDNHHVLAPTDIGRSPLHRVDVMDAVNLSMRGFGDRLRGFGGWWERHIDGFLSHNQRIVFSWTARQGDDPLYLVVIMDRFVNRFYAADGRSGGERHASYRSGDRIGFIGRGSQVDLFVPLEAIDWHIESDAAPRPIGPNEQLATLKERP